MKDREEKAPPVRPACFLELSGYCLGRDESHSKLQLHRSRYYQNINNNFEEHDLK